MSPPTTLSASLPHVHAQQGHPPHLQIIDPIVARNSIIVWAVSLLLACAGVVMLAKKAFPTAYKRFIALVTPKSSNAQQPGGTHAASLFRVRLLFCAMLMMILDGISNIVTMHAATTTGTASFVPNQLLRGISFIPAGPAFVYALSCRCAVVVTMHIKWKTRFLRAIGLVTVGVMLQMQIVLVVGVLQRLHLSPAEWISVQLFPSWTSVAMALLPIISLGGSVWSIRIAFNQPATKTTTSSSTGASSASSSHGDAPDSVSRSSVTASAGHVHSSSTALPAQAKPAEAPMLKSSTTIQYPLTRTFTILNVIVMLEWLAFIYFNTAQVPPFPVRVAAIQSFLTSLALCTEASFEWLLKMHRHRQKTVSKRHSRSIRKSGTESKTGTSSAAGFMKTVVGTGPSSPLQGTDHTHEHAH